MTTPEGPFTDLQASDLVPGVHRLAAGSTGQSSVSALATSGWHVATVDLAAAVDKAGIMDAFADGLALPAWFGRNWDALDDALMDLSWWPPGPRGRVIVLLGGDTQTPDVRAARRVIDEILESATTGWAATDTPLVVLLQP